MLWQHCPQDSHYITVICLKVFFVKQILVQLYLHFLRDAPSCVPVNKTCFPGDWLTDFPGAKIILFMRIGSNDRKIQGVGLLLEVGFGPWGGRVEAKAVLFLVFDACECVFEPTVWLKAEKLPAPGCVFRSGQRLPEIDSPFSFTIPLSKHRKYSQSFLSQPFALLPRNSVVDTQEVLPLLVSRCAIATSHFISLTGAIPRTWLRIECLPPRPNYFHLK